MNAADALAALIRALNQIDKLAEAAINGGDAEDAVEEIHDITGNLIGELARDGFVE